MAPPYRRSCLSCVKAKRKCDLSVPKCLRCSQRDIECNYGGATSYSQSDEPQKHLISENYDGHPATLNDSGESLTGLRLFYEESPESIMKSSPKTDNLESYITASDLTVLTTGTKNHDPRVSTLNDHHWEILSDSEPLDLELFRDESLDSIIKSSPKTVEVEGYITATETDPAIITTGAIYLPRVKFAARLLKNFPVTFYKNGTNGFIHRHLYAQETPKVIYDALSSCALYCSKNPSNEDLVFGDIIRKSEELVMRQHFESATELLASVQVLLIYQIIMLFDGDIRMRADAETHEDILIGWTNDLMSRIRPVNVQGPEPGDPPTDWQDWVFQESGRRTSLMVYMVKGIYWFLKYGYDDVVGTVMKMSFTGQISLWNAPSEFHWRETMKEKPPFNINIGQWESDTIGAKPPDFDDLGVLLMATHIGMDGLHEWLGKEHLGRYGLTTDQPRINDSDTA